MSPLILIIAGLALTFGAGALRRRGNAESPSSVGKHARVGPLPDMHLPTQTELTLELHTHRRKAVLVLGGGILGATIFALVMASGLEFLGFAGLLGSGCLVNSGLGRLWATGGWNLARWETAHPSIWRVDKHEVDEDWDEFATWFVLWVTPLVLSDGSVAQDGRSSPLEVRMFPRSASSGGEWRGKELLQLQDAEGTRIVTLRGKSRFWRAGGQGPWDWLVG